MCYVHTWMCKDYRSYKIHFGTFIKSISRICGLAPLCISWIIFAWELVLAERFSIISFSDVSDLFAHTVHVGKRFANQANNSLMEKWVENWLAGRFFFKTAHFSYNWHFFFGHLVIGSFFFGPGSTTNRTRGPQWGRGQPAAFFQTAHIFQV